MHRIRPALPLAWGRPAVCVHVFPTPAAANFMCSSASSLDRQPPPTPLTSPHAKTHPPVCLFVAAQVTGFDIPHSFPEDFQPVFGMDVWHCVEYYQQRFGK